MLDYLESQVLALIGDAKSASLASRPFLFGKLCVADIAIASHFLNARYAGFTVDKDNWPLLSAYLQRAWQHPAFAEQIEEEKPMIDSMLDKAGMAA